MNTIDFTQVGGFPLTQERLKFLQEAYSGPINALSKLGLTRSTPVALMGMAVSGGGNTVADGYFMYNDEIYAFTGGTVTPGGGDVALVEITVTVSTLTYKSGATPAVVTTKTATLIDGPTVTDATHFPVSALVPFGTALGQDNRDGAFTTVAVSVPFGYPGSGSITGNIDYKVDKIANTAQIKGVVTIGNPAVLPTGTLHSSQLASLGLIPTGRTVFTGLVTLAGADTGGARVARTGGGYIERVSVYLKTDGYLYADLVQAATATSYVLEFNAVVPLG